MFYYPRSLTEVNGTAPAVTPELERGWQNLILTNIQTITVIVIARYGSELLLSLIVFLSF